MSTFPAVFTFPRGVLPQWAKELGIGFPPPMHPADINAALIKSGTNQTIIAEGLGITHVSVSHVIYGRSTSIRVAEAISKATGLSIQQLWPGRYLPRRSQLRKAA